MAAPHLSAGDTLMIDCCGDSPFDHVRPFDYDMAGIAFSMLYEDRLPLQIGRKQSRNAAEAETRGVSPPSSQIRLPRGASMGILGNLGSSPQLIRTDGCSTPASNRQAVFFEA
jgi:hypothetical protein